MNLYKRTRVYVYTLILLSLTVLFFNFLYLKDLIGIETTSRFLGYQFLVLNIVFSFIFIKKSNLFNLIFGIFISFIYYYVSTLLNLHISIHFEDSIQLIIFSIVIHLLVIVLLWETVVLFINKVKF